MSDENIAIEIVEGEEAPLPVNAVFQTEEDEAKVVNYLLAEKEAAERERENMLQRVQKWRRQREARPETEKKNWPWPKASNVCVPIAAINTQGVSTFLKEAFAQRDPFWTVKSENSKDKEQIAQAAALTALLDRMSKSRYQLNLGPVIDDILDEVSSLGTQPVKVVWLKDSWVFKGKDAQGTTRQVNKVVHDGPAIIMIPFEDFITRPFFTDVQQAPWVTHRVYLFEHQMRQRFQQGRYEEPEGWNLDYITALPEHNKEQLERTGIEPGETKMWEILESHVFWDVDNDGVPEDIILTYSPKGLVYRREFNDLGVRPYVMPTYGKRAFQLYGIGVGWMAEHGQDEVDAHHNMRVDGAVLANLRMLVARKGCGIRPDEKLFAGKIWMVDDPQSDVHQLQFGEVYPSSLQAEAMAKDYTERWTAMNDYMQGFNDPMLKSRGGIGISSFLAGQGGKIQTNRARYLITAFSEIGQLVLFQLVRNKERVVLDGLPEDEAARISAVLNMNVEDIPTKFSFTVETTDLSETEANKRQALMTLTQLYTLYFKDITEAVIMAANPQMAQLPMGSLIQEIALKHYTGASHMMEKILRYFDELDTGRYIPDYRVIEQMQEMIAQKRAGGVTGGIAGRGPGGLIPGGGTAQAGGAAGQPPMGAGEQGAGAPGAAMAQPLPAGAPQR